MANNDPRQWMWSEALDALARAERAHRQIFQPAVGQARRPSWEPPVDVFETAAEVVLIAALPGVSERSLAMRIEGPCLVISGERSLPRELRGAVVHRLELPRGHFERRVPLPSGRYGQVRHDTRDGCLVVTLRKLA